MTPTVTELVNAPFSLSQDLTPEQRERAAAWRRGTGADPNLPGQAGAPLDDIPELRCGLLADNVREYAVFVLDNDGIIRVWGESARLMKWWTRQQAQGSHLRILYPAGGSEDGTAEEHLKHAAERGEYTGEGHRVRSDESTFWARVTLTALRAPDGTLRGFAKVVRDFTAERAALMRAHRAVEFAEEEQRRAEERTQAKNLFAATVSHELRGPLNALMGYLKLLEHEKAGPLNDVQRSHLGRMGKISTHLLTVISDVLDETRLESRRFVIAGSPRRLGDAIEAALMVVEPAARQKGIRLENVVAAYGAQGAYLGDEGRVRQILINVVGNAVKFTPAGGIVKVSAGLAESVSPEAQVVGPGPWVYVRVEDTGPGIAREEINAIFEPFEQGAADPSVEGVGAGLGLAISRRLARLMGGDVTVRSQFGEGATFFMWLPAGDETLVR